MSSIRELRLKTESGPRFPRGATRPNLTQSPGVADTSGLTSALLKLGSRGPSLASPVVLEYLNRLPQCGAILAFRLCPAAFKLLCALAGAIDRSGDSIGQIGEAAGIKSPATRAAALGMLTALGLVSIERARGQRGEVRGTHWRLLDPPSEVRDEARTLVKEIIANRIERAQRIECELPGSGSDSVFEELGND